MRVAILAHSAPGQDAVGNQVAEKVAFFQERECGVHVFLHSAGKLHPNLKSLATEEREPRMDGAAWRFLAGCDLVLVEYSQYFPLLDLLPLLARSKTRIAVNYHGVTPVRLGQGNLRQILQDGCRQRGLIFCADWVLTESSFATEELFDAISFPRDRITRLDLPIDDRFQAGGVQGYLRRRLGIGAGRILLFVGRIAANKRPRTLIETLQRLKDEPQPFHAVFVGDMSDVYAEQARECRELAREIGVAERVHFLGQLGIDDLASAYRSADLFVMPSLHEGFCQPVREAMACGLPVLAARTSALPETIGDGGLTFSVEDPEDLARQVRRVFEPVPERVPRKRIALVCFRFGRKIVGGAERSLRTIGEALSRHGYAVEVFTTCNLSESQWRNEADAGTETEGELLVHRFPMDPHDRERHLKSLTRLPSSGAASVEAAEEYVRHSIHSTALLETLEKRLEEFDAFIVGPYLFGLTCDVARRFPERTLLLPCFHDEPLAWLPIWPSVYGQVGGILYHTPEEQEFAQGRLGINHPNAGVIGTCLPDAPVCEETRPASHRPYLVYCGRYSIEKNVPRLLEYAERYQAFRPGTVDLVFMGQGDVTLPRRDWLIDLGRVDEGRKAQVLRDAMGLVQLSEHESLSLVVLEAWREGTPVVVASGSVVLRGQVERSGGGVAVEGFDDFARTLDLFLEQPEVAREMGAKGRSHVQGHYQDEARFAGQVRTHIENLRRPLVDLLREKGLERARRSSRAAWREGFGQWVEQVLHASERERRLALSIKISQRQFRVPPGQSSVLIPLQISNEGTLPAADKGPGRTLLHGRITSEDGAFEGRLVRTELPQVLVPGRSVPAALTLPCPRERGTYRIEVWAAGADAVGQAASLSANSRNGFNPLEGGSGQAGSLSYEVSEWARLCVGDAGAPSEGDMSGHTANAADGQGCLEVAQRALAEAHAQRRLPDDYVDVTEGWFVKAKRWVKQKILGNFRHAYVDVLSRQQSEVNQQLVVALQMVAEHGATLEHALATLQRRLDELERRPAAPLVYEEKASSQENDQLTGLPSA